LPAIFVDTSFYVALLVPSDDLYPIAHEFWERASDVQYLTCDPVLVEVLAHLSGLGRIARRRGVDLVDALRADAEITIVRQTPDLFDAGLDLYRHRIDKGYSLTDCMSMVVCRQRRIRDVLTHDHHFQQEGFAILL
jgi:predicted nucleic acid-binding protein